MTTLLQRVIEENERSIRDTSEIDAEASALVSYFEQRYMDAIDAIKRQKQRGEWIVWEPVIVGTAASTVVGALGGFIGSIGFVAGHATPLVFAWFLGLIPMAIWLPLWVRYDRHLAHCCALESAVNRLRALQAADPKNGVSS